MCVKYQYSFSIKEMQRLICTNESAQLNDLTQKVYIKIGNSVDISPLEAEKFLTHVKNALSTYYIIQKSPKKYHTTFTYILQT